MIRGSQVGSEYVLIGSANDFFHKVMQGFEGRAFADRNHHATPPRGGEGFEIRRSPIRVTVVLGGVDPVMEAE